MTLGPNSDIQTFYAPGEAWWEKPAHGTVVTAYILGGGGPGGQGTSDSGGGGGGGGGLVTGQMPMALFSTDDQWPVFVGDGGITGVRQGMASEFAGLWIEGGQPGAFGGLNGGSEGLGGTDWGFNPGTPGEGASVISVAGDQGGDPTPDHRGGPGGTAPHPAQDVDWIGVNRGYGGDGGGLSPANMPIGGLVEGNATVVGTKVYFDGGSSGGDSSFVQPYRMLSYDTVANSWATLTPFAGGAVDRNDYRSQYYDQLITVDALIYSIQVQGNGHVHRYDPGSDSWADLVSWDGNFASKPSGWDHLFWSGTATEPGDYATQVAGGGSNMYVWGYRHLTVGMGESNIPDFWSWTPASNTWAHLADTPAPLEGLGVVTNGKLYILGRAIATSGATSRIYAYDIAANIWTSPAGGVYPYFGQIDHLVALGTKLYAVGPNQVNAYDTLADSWSNLSSAIPGSRIGNVPATAGSDLYIFGGQASTTLFIDVLTPLRSLVPQDGQPGAIIIVTTDEAPKYLRMNQRDDGLGVTRSPRLSGAGSNGPTSVVSPRSSRLARSNTYLRDRRAKPARIRP